MKLQLDNIHCSNKMGLKTQGSNSSLGSRAQHDLDNMECVPWMQAGVEPIITPAFLKMAYNLPNHEFQLNLISQ